MKRILSIVVLLLVAFSYAVFAQGTTVSIGSVTAQPGQSVNVPINVTNFTNVGAISLTITYNQSALMFTGVANAPSGLTFTAGASGGVLKLGWFDVTASTPFPVQNGKIVDVVFTYAGGTSPLTFTQADCEIATEAGVPLAVTYQNGVVAAVAVKLTLGTLTASRGSAINVPINAENFRKVGATSLKISYNPAVITFVKDTAAATGIQFTRNAAGGVLSLAWFDTSGRGVTIGTTGTGKLVDLRFTYAGGSSNLDFQTTQCELSDSAGGPLAVTYVNGKVNPVPAEAVSVSLDSTAFPVGATFALPVNVRNFKSVGAISLKIKYNAAVLTFTGISNAIRAAFTSSASTGTLSIGWFSAGPVTPITLAAGKLLDINFTFNGGTSALEFLGTCEIADSTGAVLSGVLYNNGNIVAWVPTPGWVVQTSGATADLNSVKAVSPTVAWAAGNGGVVLRTVNGGYKWQSVNLPVTDDVYIIDAISADTAFASTSPAAGGYIYRTLNGGTTWTQVLFQAGGFLDGIRMVTSTTGYCVGDPVGGKWTFYKTTDGGATWARIATEPTQVGGEWGAVNGLATVGTNYIWFTPGTSTKRVYRSTNGGATWSSGELPVGAFSPSIWFLDPRFGLAGWTGSSAGLARTVDSGKTWQSVTVGGTGSFYGIYGTGVDFWVTRGSSVYRSTNRGSSFGLTPEFASTGTFLHMNGVGAGTPGSSVSAWGVGSGGYVSAGYVATVTGVGDNPKETIPVAFDLAQNYPNPFNPSTTIEYALPVRSTVTVRIYDMLGREVRTLASGVQEAGTFKAVWDGRSEGNAQVSSGIYVYRIEASPVDGGSPFTSLKKMVLLK